MTPYFDSLGKQARLVAIARGWLGTPFHPHAALRGVGVDCVHLLAEIYREAGLLGGYELPRYSMDGGDHEPRSQVLSWLLDHRRFEQVAGGGLEVGDLVTFRLGRVPHHVGMVLGPSTFIHAIRDYGVIESHLDDPTYAKRREHVFRPVP